MKPKFKKCYEPKLLPFTEPLRAQLDALPVLGYIIRDRRQYEWNPSYEWKRRLLFKSGKRIEMRSIGPYQMFVRTT